MKEEIIMKWKNLLLCVVLIIVSMTGSVKAFSFEKSSEYRTDTGTFIGKIYKEESDSYSMAIETSDGNKWIVDNYVHKLFEDCIVTFDTNGTEEVEDDKIIAITINSVIEEG
jgi:hypothetical protein